MFEVTIRTLNEQLELIEPNSIIILNLEATMNNLI